MSALADDRSGAVFALAAVFSGVLGSVALKLLSVTPPVQAIAERSFAAAAVLLVLVLVTRAPLIRLPGSAWLRASLDALAGLAFALAVFDLPLALLSAILATLPLVVTVMARVTLGEPIGARPWAALALGFAGVLCILRPGLAISPQGLALALASVVAYAARDTVTRRLPADTATLSVALAAALMIGASTLLLPRSEGWIAPPAEEVGLIALTALSFIAANTFIILAYRRTEISAIAPLRYTSVLWSLLFDALIWNVVPGPFGILGIALILAAGSLLIARRR